VQHQRSTNTEKKPSSSSTPTLPHYQPLRQHLLLKRDLNLIEYFLQGKVLLPTETLLTLIGFFLAHNENEALEFKTWADSKSHQDHSGMKTILSVNLADHLLDLDAIFVSLFYFFITENEQPFLLVEPLLSNTLLTFKEIINELVAPPSSRAIVLAKGTINSISQLLKLQKQQCSKEKVVAFLSSQTSTASYFQNLHEKFNLPSVQHIQSELSTIYFSVTLLILCLQSENPADFLMNYDYYLKHADLLKESILNLYEAMAKPLLLVHQTIVKSCSLRQKKILADNNAEQFMQELDEYQKNKKAKKALREERKKSQSLTPDAPPPVKPSRSRRQRKKQAADPLNVAYRFFSKKEFSQAEAFYIKARNQARSNINFLYEIQALSTLGDCYRFWSLSELNHHPEIASEKRKQAIVTYTEAIDLALCHQEESIYAEMEFYHWEAEGALAKLYGVEPSENAALEQEIQECKYADSNEVILPPRPELTHLENATEQSEPSLPLTKERESPGFLAHESCISCPLELPLSPEIMSLMSHLNQYGKSYVTGGFVRNFLLGLAQPTDIDLVCSLHPQEIIQALRAAHYKCEIVSKSFPIVLVYLPGGGHIEVSTFRGKPCDTATEYYGLDPEQGIITFNWHFSRTPEFDYLHRDFTSNVILYDPFEKQALSFDTRAFNDIRAKYLRTVIDAEISFKRDPIRMLRALEFHHKLHLQLDSTLTQALTICHQQLSFVPPKRRLHQLMKITHSGQMSRLLPSLQQYQLLASLFPQVTPYLECDAHFFHLVQHLCFMTDARIHHRQNVDITLFFAVLLFPSLLHALFNNNEPFQDSSQAIFNTQNQFTYLPQELCFTIQDIWNSYLLTHQQPYLQTCFQLPELTWIFSMLMDWHMSRRLPHYQLSSLESTSEPVSVSEKGMFGLRQQESEKHLIHPTHLNGFY